MSTLAHEPAELEVIGACLMGGVETVDRLADHVTPGDFANRKLSAAFWAILRLAEMKQPIDAMSVAYTMTGGDWGRLNGKSVDEASLAMAEHGIGTRSDEHAWLMAIEINTMTHVNASHHARRVAGYSKLRRLQIELDRASALASKADPFEADATANAAADAIMGAFADRHAASIATWDAEMQETIRRAMALLKGESAPTVLTGFADLDRMLVRGMKPATLTLVGGLSGHGKTAFAVALAANAARAGNEVMYVSMEVGKDQISDRLAAMESRVDMACLARAPGPTRDQADQLIRGRNASKEWGPRLTLVDTPPTTIPEICRHIRRQERRGKAPGVVVIDYGQLAKAVGRHGNREQAVAEVADGAFEAAKVYHCAVIVPLQLNRDFEKRADKRPRMSDIRESSRWETHCDVGLFIHRPHKHDSNQPANIAEIVVDKCRNGATGVARLNYWPEQNRFADIDWRHS